MNQDKYPGIYAAMGEMEKRRCERFPMGEMEKRRYENFPMNEMEMRRFENNPMNEMEMRRHERLPLDEMDVRRRKRVPAGSEMRRREYNPMGEAGIRYENTNIGCIDREQVIEDPRLAHAYVPIQKLCSTFTPMTALRKGTIFPGLVNVYGWESKQFGGEYL